MAAVSLQDVFKEFSGRTILDRVTLDLHPGRIVGVVGPNGAGKSTLFKLILGQLEPDRGMIRRSKSVPLGYLSQDPEINLDRSIHDEVLSVFDELLDIEQRIHVVSEQMADPAHADRLESLMAEYDRLNDRFVAAGGHEYEQRIGEILGGLGFKPDEWTRPVRVLSGGQKCRVALARLLLENSRYLLLDEPTNHLDIDAVRWLEKFLVNQPGGAAVISHDRYLLDRLTDSIIEVDRLSVRSYAGNYTTYQKTRAAERLTLTRQVDKDREFIEKEQEFIRRHLAGQRTKEAQGRRTRLERRIASGEFELEGPAEERRVAFDFRVAYQPEATVFAAEDLAMAYGDTRLFSDLSFRVEIGERIGITGPNGTGKTTLLKILMDRLKPTAGSVQRDRKADLGYFTQDASDLDPDLIVLESLREVRPEFTDERLRSLLGSFGFSGDRVFMRQGTLSGGEQSRVRLLKLLLTSPNVLILDEPTNHLDIASREALEAALNEYPGTIVAVSHDRYFLDRIATRLLVMRPEGCRMIRGGYTVYIEQLEREQAAALAAADEQVRAARSTARPRQEAKPRSQASRWERMKLEQIEERVMECEQTLQQLDFEFANPAVYGDPDKVRELRVRYDQVRQELSEAEQAWEARVSDS